MFFPSLKDLLAGAVKCYGQDAFCWTNTGGGLALEEDFNKSKPIWDEFGSTKTH